MHFTQNLYTGDDYKAPQVVFYKLKTIMPHKCPFIRSHKSSLPYLGLPMTCYKTHHSQIIQKTETSVSNEQGTYNL